MKIQPFKIKVNPEQSAKVQEILFKNGYEWLDGTQETQLLYCNQIAFDLSDGDLAPTIGQVFEFEKYPAEFEKYPADELTYSEFIKLYDK
jgi:hypothetical protein